MKSSVTGSRISTQQAGLALIALLFLPASFFFQPNLGGEGLSISHNITVWVTAVLIISTATLLLLKQQAISYPAIWLALLAFPASLILLGFTVENFRPTEWVIRQCFVLGGFLFLFALFQFNWQRRDIEKVLLIILLAAIAHGLYGISQLIWPTALPLIRTPSNGTPYSTFQQINIHASFQATALLIAFYLLSRPLTRKASPGLMLFLTCSVAISTYIVSVSGSRVGLLSSIAGLVILLFCFWRPYLQRKTLLLIIITAISAAAMTGSQGLERSSAKFDALATTNADGVAVSGSSSRINIYKVTLDLFVKSPITGYGIGSFQKEWHEGKVVYLKQHPTALFPADRLSHPHNEIMFWLIEGGLIAIIGLAISVIAVIITTFRCGWRRGLAYLTLMLPIALHTQVELPFYISNLPWLLLMTLIFICLSHKHKSRPLGLSKAAEKTAGLSAIILFAGITWLMVQAIQANHGIIRFLQGRMAEPALLQPALQSPFFTNTAEVLFMRTMLLRELNAKHGHFAPQFIEWAEEFIEYQPIPQLYIDLARAYLATGEKEQALKAIRDGLARYPENPAINNIEQKVREKAEETINVKPASTGQDPQQETPAQSQPEHRAT